MELSGQLHSPTALPQGKSPYPLNRKVGGPQSRSGRGSEEIKTFRCLWWFVEIFVPKREGVLGASESVHFATLLLGSLRRMRCVGHVAYR
jgi:hypothetical protein